MNKISDLKDKSLILIAIALLALACGAILCFNDPSSTWWMPRCFFHTITGLDCPSCGSTRALYAIMHGEFLRGISYNPFIVVSWPLLAVIAAVYLFFPAQRQSRWLWRLIVTYITLFLVWWVLRNLLGI